MRCDMTSKDDSEPFLSRWSRLKKDAREDPSRDEPAKAEQAQPAPDLPPIEDLNHDSDFSVFMDKRVDHRLRRLALKKLFTDPSFNVPDGLDDYAEDYTLLEDLPEEMVALQEHAKRVLRGPETEEKPEAHEPTAANTKEQTGDQAGTGPGASADAHAQRDAGADGGESSENRTDKNRRQS